MTPAGLAKAEPGGSTRFTPQAAGNVSSLTKFFEQQGQAASEAQPAAAAAGGASPAPHISKRQRLGSVSAHPPLPAEWPTTSPPLAHNGAASASAVTGTPLEGRQLWGDDGSGDAAAREARLASIRAKFGTKRFHPAQELPPAELRALLGAAEADLSPDDYKLHRWDALPVVLGGSSNPHALNWVLTGQSGCVGLASSAAFLFVLGAGQTIGIEDADAVHAARDEAGVALRLGKADSGDRLTLKVTDPAASDAIVATINARANLRAALRRKQAAGAAATNG